MKQEATTRKALKEQTAALRQALTAYLEQTMNAEARAFALQLNAERLSAVANHRVSMAAAHLNIKFGERRKRITETLTALSIVENKMNEW